MHLAKETQKTSTMLAKPVLQRVPEKGMGFDLLLKNLRVFAPLRETLTFRVRRKA